MKIKYVKQSVLLSCFLFALFCSFTLPLEEVQAAKEMELSQIPYTKWGEFAVRVAKDAFPNYEVSDYKYIGRQVKSRTTSQDQFELILTRDSQKRDVIVSILFNTQSGDLISVNFEEK